MYVRYLQHQHHGTVQLLMMPLSTAAGSVKSSRWSEKAEDDDNIECEPVPLPIQTFLWRQTNPFLGAKSYKLHEASSVTFERVVVQNILHGLSPSLSDAIASVSRWRFVRAAFPHIIQCCAALLSERVNENDPIPVSGSLAKLLYILHWLLMDAATECNESTFGDSGDGVISVRQLAFSVASIQLFVYLLAPLFYHINEEEIESHIRLESGLRLWQAFWQYRTPDILCFCAPVKQRRCQLPQVTMSKKLPAATAVEQGIYLGDENIANRRLSQVPQISVTIPPPKPPRTDLTVLREIQQKQKTDKHCKKDDLPPPIPKEPPPSESFSDDAGKSSCSIVRSVSDYKTNEVAAELQGKLNLKKSRTDVFHKSPDYSDSDIFNGLRDIDEAMKFAEDNSLSDIFHLNDKAAPLVLLQEICSAASIDNSDGKSSNGIEPICLKCGKRIVPSPLNASDKCLCKNGSVSIEIPAILATKQAENKIIINGTKPTESLPETSSSGSQQTVINMTQQKQPQQPQQPQQQQQQQRQSPPTVLLEGTWKDSASMHSTDKPDVLIDPHEASYLDIAILRCLLIENWAEEGVFWALKFLLNRLTDIRHYRLMHDGTFRSRSNSVPTTAPRGSRQDVLEADYLTWSDLQERTEINNTSKSVDEQQVKTEIIIEDSSKTKSDIFNKKNQLTVSADKRRVSVNTLPAIKKASRAEKRKLPRSKSDPLLSRALEYMEPCRGTSISENVENGDSKMIQQNFFPEATGSSLFIEKNGHIDLTVVLSVIRSLIERCGAVRILEIALNVCDTLLTMTNVDPSVFFENILKIVLRTYLHMGCPNGCNEGMRTPQADFLQIKARNLLSQLYKINPNTFTKLLKKQVSENTVQQLLDCIHAITVFCQAEMGPHRSKLNRNRRRSSAFIQHSEATRLPSYRNHFNENHSGIEGVIIDTILTPLTSKVMNKIHELFLPENMGLYQDVRLFVSHVDENHGNPFRRTALSALAAKINAEEASNNDAKSVDNSDTESMKHYLTVNNSHSKDNTSLRRGLFKKKDVRVTTEESEGESSPSTPRDVPSADDTVSVGGSPSLTQNCKQQKKSGGKLQFAFNLLKSSVKNDASEDENWTDEATAITNLNPDDADSSCSATLDSRQNRISFRNAAQRVNYQRQSVSTDNVLDTFDKPTDLSAISLTQTYLPPKRLVNIMDVREGARRFAFLLETCKPGQVPDAPLLSAVSELKAPVLSRAVILLECSHFVYRCNRGDWPEWIRSGSTQPRPLGPNVPSNNAPSRPATSGSRKAFLMQRAAGRNFYEWALQIGVRLQIALEREETRSKQKEDKKRLKAMDDLENFLDDGTVNDLSGDGCPIALQLIAYTVLFEITAFLRETFQLIPRSKITHKNAGSNSGWEKLMSHRRWSILSNTFNQQGSIHSINDLHPAMQPERRVSYSTADEESSPRGSHDLIEEPQLTGNAEKKVRRLAQGRQRLLKRGSPSGQPHASLESSHKKRETSFRLRKQSRSPAALENDENLAESAPLMVDSEGGPFSQQRRKTTSLRSSTKWNIRSTRLRSPGSRTSQIPAGLPPPISTIDGQFVSATSVSQVGVPLGNRQRDSLKPKNPTSGNADDHERSGSQREGTGGIADHFSPERRTTGSYSSSQHGGIPTAQQQQQMIHSIEDSEDEMLKNMPWIKTIIEFSKKFDMECTHQKYCTRWCYERVYRQCFRLNEAFKVVYDDDLSQDSIIDKRKQFVESWQAKQDFTKQKRVSNPRRESATVRQSGVDRVPMALRGLLIEKLNEIEETKSNKKESNLPPEAPVDSTELTKKRSPMLNFLRTQILSIPHVTFSALLKSAIILTVDQYKSVLPFSWKLLIHNDSHIAAAAASMFICCAVKCPDDAINTIKENLTHPDPNVRTEAVQRFFSLWRHRFHVWLKMEDGAQFIFKVPPPGIDFTLPSPPIGQAQLPVVDSPWMPHVKTKVEELSLKEEEHSTSQTIMTMTRTRRKQKQEMVKRAVREAEERQCELRQQFPLRATAIVQQAAYEPALFYHQTSAQQQQQQAQAQQSSDGTGEEEIVHAPTNRHQMPVAQPLFPSSILSAVPQIIEMLDDVHVDKNGVSVSDICRKTIWNCLIEDSTLFLRHFLEKLTNKDKQEYLFALLRKIVLTFRPLPSQTAYALLNYMFGFVMFYVRSPSDGSDKTLAHALSLIWLVAPYVNGLYFKDLKQTLKKEQCDQALMITANVPSAKRIIVHGPDSASGGIPTQFSIHEDTQFTQILVDSLEFFHIPQNEVDDYFLVDAKTGFVHNPSAFVRDFYFFHRSFYPQLTLIKLNRETATIKMRQAAFQQKLIEIGKVLLTHNALKYSPEAVVPQRIFFLHDEFTHLPSFPRRSLESCFGMYQGPMGNELHSIDSMHKYVWSKLMTDMFEKMENAFMFGDLHLFINVINGIMIIHCEDLLILRRCMATYITMAIHFNTLFASQGFFLIMPTILRCYSQRQTNRLFTQIIEFVCKQFYILHRKPFLLQMFGSIAEICDQNNNDLEINAMLVKAKYLFNLMKAMENMNELVDQLDILSLVPYPKPLKALDLCYRDDPNAFFILTDAMASCVTVCAFSPESRRSHQMLLIMQALMPYYIQHLEKETTEQSNNPAAVKHEIHAYNTMCVEIKALINSCETLARGPTRTFDLVNTVSDRGKSLIAESPVDPPTVVEEDKGGGKEKKSAVNTGWDAGGDNIEMEKEIFRGARDALLTLCALFIEKAGARLKELTKLATTLEHTKIPELLDHKCHVKLSEIALSLLKIAPYDHITMSCQGLQKYFMIILPVADWSVETNRSALNIILRRLDKTIAKVGKKLSVRKRANWTAISNWLIGLYNTLTAYPYIAHLHPLKTITQMCLRLTVGDPCTEDVAPGQQGYLYNNSNTILNASTPPPIFCNTVLKLTSFLMQALGQFAFSLEFVCSSDGLGVAADRLEAVLSHVLIPLFLRAAMPGKESPQFQQKDILYCLNVIHNAISPSLAKQSLAPVTSATLATSLIRGTVAHDTTGRQGSVSVTDRGHSATVSTHRLIRDSVVQSIFLALKTMIVSFQKQLSTHWTKIARIVKDIVAKRVGGPLLFSFIDFLLGLNLPISLMIVPIIHNKLSQKPITEQEALWQQEFRERITNPKPGSTPDSIRGYYSLLNKLCYELQAMKEDFSTRLIELPLSHTPTIGDLHSDSGSSQSVSTHRSSHSRPNNDTRRMSTSNAFSKLRKAPAEGAHNIQDTTILEDTEDELAQMIGGKVSKSPSLPFNRISINQSRTRSIGGIGMWRSIRRKSRMFGEEPLRNNVELKEMHRRTRSWNKRLASKNSTSEDSIVITPLTMPETTTTKLRSDVSSSTTSNSKSDKGGSEAEKGGIPPHHHDRQRIVSFSTPKKESLSQTISDADSDEFCITSRHHLI